MNLSNKIKASALQFAILVSVIVALLLGSFLALTHTQRYFGIQSKFFIEVIEASTYGVSHALNPTTSINDSIQIETKNGNILIEKGYWGGYTIIKSTASIKTKTFQKKALIGAKVTNPQTGVYIGDNRLPLVLVGDCELEGAVYVSNKGIKPGVISGHYYNGKEIAQMNLRISAGSLPKIDKAWINSTKQTLEFVPGSDDLVVPIKLENSNSFFKPVQVIYEQGKLTLVESYTGNIIIKSETEIIISRDAKLMDVLIIAPKILVEAGFSGNAHLLAQERIKIDENVTLQYPSSITLLDKNEDFKKAYPKGEEPIYVSDKSNISGNVIYLAKENIENRSNTSISISSLATIEGSIYCNGNTEILGTVIGSVYSNRFVANEFGSKYLNHIYNGKILGNDLTKQFSGLPFEKTSKSVAKWLY